MRQRRRYNRTISRAASASPTSRLVNKRPCSGSWFAAGLISRASTRVIDPVAASVLANLARPLEGNRTSPQGDRRGPAGIAQAAWRHLDLQAPQIRPGRRAGEQRPCDNRPIRCALDRTVLRRTNPRRPTGEALSASACSPCPQSPADAVAPPRSRRHGSRSVRRADREQPPSGCQWRPGDG